MTASTRHCFFTSIALNYSDKALALADSVFAIYPDAQFIISIIDYSSLSKETLLSLDDLKRNLFEQGRKIEFLDPLNFIEQPKLFTFKFNVVEACTSVKPSVALHLLSRFSDVTYLDPDTILYAPLPADPYMESEWDFQVTPHILAPATGMGKISERLFLSYGTFNLGYFAVRAKPQSIDFLKWWHDFCVSYGADAPLAGLFVDQKPVDLLPSFVDRLSVVRHPGCNVAWWNLFCDGRKVSDAGLLVEFRAKSYQLVFYHFSNQDTTISERRLVARPLKSLLPDGGKGGLMIQHQGLQSLHDDYAVRISQGRDVAPKGFMHVLPGARVPLYVRLLMAEALRRGMLYKENPFDRSVWIVAFKAWLHLVRNFHLSDLKMIISVSRRMVRSIVTLTLFDYSS